MQKIFIQNQLKVDNRSQDKITQLLERHFYVISLDKVITNANLKYSIKK